MELSSIMLCEEGLTAIARLDDGRRPLGKECGQPLEGGKVRRILSYRREDSLADTLLLAQ